MAKVQISTAIGAELKVKLKQLSLKTERSQSKLIEEGIEYLIKKYELDKE